MCVKPKLVSVYQSNLDRVTCLNVTVNLVTVMHSRTQSPSLMARVQAQLSEKKIPVNPSEAFDLSITAAADGKVSSQGLSRCFAVSDVCLETILAPPARNSKIPKAVHCSPQPAERE